MNKKTTKKTRKSSANPKTGATTKASRKKATKSGDFALIIVESPTKARTLGKYLNSFDFESFKKLKKESTVDSFMVMASGGHIIDLPKKKIGVDVENSFEPEYELLRDKSVIAGELKRNSKEAQLVFIATDPDREGEAIGWHIKNLINSKEKNKIWRVQFNEITRNAVHNSLKTPGNIDQNKVDAQVARRVMDRLVGYQVSPLLWKTVNRGLSAGRVQSVALRLICEREEEISKFKKEEYWSIDGFFTGKKVELFKTILQRYDNKKVKISNEKESRIIIKQLESASYYVVDVKKTRKKRNPAPPYITSTLQQDAGRRLGMSVKKTMSIAQKLYEGGKITYMRTDSTRISTESIGKLRDYISVEYGPEYVNKSVRVFKNKKGAIQDAHEAIRPTDVKNSPKKFKSTLGSDEYRLYELIWKRFAATQMMPAELDVTTISIGDKVGIEFRVSGQIITFPGFLLVYEDIVKDKKDNDEKSDKIPANIETGMPLDLNKIIPNQHFTQPPPRFTEAGLVKILDELGIGRPSTYATIISTLLDRKYIERVEKALPPTELGQTVNRVLVNQFPDVFNADFTANMENELDKVETGSKWPDVVSEFYLPFSDALQKADENYKEIKKKLVTLPVGKKCPDCGMELVFRWGRSGKFISCSGFPTCKYAENLNKVEPVDVDIDCPVCGEKMILREGRFGKFYGCKKYPKCKGILPFTLGLKCPEDDCKGELSKRKSKKGRVFYGCSNYPKCDFVTWNEPVKGVCPNCKTKVLFVKKSAKTGDRKICLKCDYKE